jgi:hypothetical protein
MRYWFDTEFIERGPDYPIELLSIGIVAEDGREFYAENVEANLEVASEGVKENVLPYLGDPLLHATLRTDIATQIVEFCDPERYGKPEFWAYFADYDWVVLCQLFGTMMDLPKGWLMYCRDIKQFAVMLGDPKLPEQGKDEHHALADARWNRTAWEFLVAYGRAAGFPRTLLE